MSQTLVVSFIVSKTPGGVPVLSAKTTSDLRRADRI
jgi:hypothetical protein